MHVWRCTGILWYQHCLSYVVTKESWWWYCESNPRLEGTEGHCEAYCAEQTGKDWSSSKCCIINHKSIKGTPQRSKETKKQWVVLLYSNYSKKNCNIFILLLLMVRLHRCAMFTPNPSHCAFSKISENTSHVLHNLYHDIASQETLYAKWQLTLSFLWRLKYAWPVSKTNITASLGVWSTVVARPILFYLLELQLYCSVYRRLWPKRQQTDWEFGHGTSTGDCWLPPTWPVIDHNVYVWLVSFFFSNDLPDSHCLCSASTKLQTV